MARDGSSNRPRPVRAGAAPTTPESASLEDRFPVALTVKDDDGVQWQVRVAGGALAGRAQAGRNAESVPELVLLVFTRQGDEEPTRELLLPGAGLRRGDGSWREDVVHAALEEAVPYQGGTPRGAGFFEGTRQRRGR
jgi:hypothetical protein